MIGRARVLCFALLASLVFPVALGAHVGSPDTFFAGMAGSYPVRVTVRPPGVVPGLAEVFVRVEGPGVRAVSLRPMLATTGPSGAPGADVAKPVAGQPGLYSASVWLMTAGTYALEVSVDGDRGSGQATVPVTSIATRTLSMSPGFVVLVGALALLLVAGGLAIVYGAASEATLPAGESATPDRRRRAWVATTAAALAFLLLLWGERAWSASVAKQAGDRVFRPYAAQAAADAAPSGRILRLSIVDPRWGAKGYPNSLLPDHGKLVHLFAVREPMLDAFAHLHPVPVSERAFESAFPPLPAGEYRVFADVTDEFGISQTLVSRARVPAPRPRSDTVTFTDPDDSWRVSPPLPAVADATPPVDLGGGWRMTWEHADQPVLAGRECDLAFAIRDGEGRPAPLEPYMGMLAHAAVLRADGSVFVHLHPMGTVSMAALDAAAGESGMAGMDHSPSVNSDPGARVALPYAFPKPGPYRIWVQVKIAGEVRTGVFDVLVR